MHDNFEVLIYPLRSVTYCQYWIL